MKGKQVRICLNPTADDVAFQLALWLCRQGYSVVVFVVSAVSSELIPQTVQVSGVSLSRLAVYDVQEGNLLPAILTSASVGFEYMIAVLPELEAQLPLSPPPSAAILMVRLARVDKASDQVFEVVISLITLMRNHSLHLMFCQILVCKKT